VNRHEAAGDEVEPRLIEPREQCAHVVRGEHLQVRGIVLGLASGEESQSVLQAVGVRDRRDERAAGTQDTPRLCNETAGVA
jgi:hypothetical protein